MPTVLRRPSPTDAAQAEVIRLEAQHQRLTDRLAGAVAAVESAQAARHSALLDGDPDAAAMAKLDRRCNEANEARSGVMAAAQILARQLDEATRHRDGLQDAARRAEIAADSERRASALDAAAEALAGAALNFNDARTAMVRALAEHGAAVSNPLSTDGSTPAALLATPIVRAALRMAAPSLQPAADGLGHPYDTDPILVVRRAQSGRLRDFAESVVAGTVPAVELPRPRGTAAPIDPNNPFTAPAKRVRGVFSQPFSYIATGGALIMGEPGDVEVPAEVLRIAVEMRDVSNIWSTVLCGPSGWSLTVPGNIQPRGFGSHASMFSASTGTGVWSRLDRT